MKNCVSFIRYIITSNIKIMWMRVKLQICVVAAIAIVCTNWVKYCLDQLSFTIMQDIKHPNTAALYYKEYWHCTTYWMVVVVLLVVVVMVFVVLVVVVVLAVVLIMVVWFELDSSSYFILVKWMFKLKKVKLGWMGLNTSRVKFQNVFEVYTLS